jgi:hypothetical protein
MSNLGQRLTAFTEGIVGPKYAGASIGESTPSYILPLVGTLVVIAIIVISVVVSLQYKAKRPPYKLLGPIDLFAPEAPILVDRPTVKANMLASYTLSIYFMMDAVPDMRTSGTPLLAWPGVWGLHYNAPKEEFLWIFTETPYNTTPPGPVTVKIAGIPLQRWNQIVMTFEGRTADMYCNGTLLSSTTLPNVPPLPNSSIELIPGNIMGKAAYIQVWPKRLTTGEVSKNYIETSDSQGRPYIGKKLTNPLKLPNLFCPGGQCCGKDIASGEGLHWEFPYQ